jgi:hypothetical protein
LAQVAQAGQQAPRLRLQQAVAAYLSLRNYAPLASAFLGPGQAVGGGEPSRLQRLRRYEAGEPDTAEVLRTTLWELLDPRTLGFAIDLADTDTLPGLRGKTAARRSATARDMITRHLVEVSHAYPRAYRAARFTRANLRKLVKDTDMGVSEVDDPPAAADVEPTAAPATWSTRSATGTEVTLAATDAAPRRITNVTVAGRNVTLLNTDGHHLTAHTVFTRQVRAALEGETVPAARRNMVELADQIFELPSMPVPTDTAVHQRLVDAEAAGERTAIDTARAAWRAADRSLDDADPRGIFGACWAAFIPARDAVQNAVDDVATIEALHDLAAAYICLRNALPLVAVRVGAYANSGGEPEALRRLDRYERTPGSGQPAEICGALWRLLDMKAMGEMYDDDIDLADVAPGAPTDRNLRLQWVLDAHHRSIRALWPGAYKISGFASENSLRYAIDELAVSTDAFQRIRDAALFDAPGGTVPRYTTTSTDDDEEFADPGGTVDQDLSDRPSRTSARLAAKRKATTTAGGPSKIGRINSDDEDETASEDDTSSGED